MHAKPKSLASARQSALNIDFLHYQTISVVDRDRLAETKFRFLCYRTPQIGARQPGPALVRTERLTRTVAEQAAPVPRAGVMQVGRGWIDTCPQASRVGNGRLYVRQRDSFLG